MFAAQGLAYSPPPDVVPNSRNALRVTELARDRGLHEPVHDRLMDAYWSEGTNIGDAAALRTLAAEAGLDAAEVDDVLEGDAYLDRVEASTGQAVSVGVTGVPGWVLDGRMLLLGAQPREVFEAAFERLRCAAASAPRAGSASLPADAEEAEQSQHQHDDQDDPENAHGRPPSR